MAVGASDSRNSGSRENQPSPITNGIEDLKIPVFRVIGQTAAPVQKEGSQGDVWEERTFLTEGADHTSEELRTRTCRSCDDVLKNGCAKDCRPSDNYEIFADAEGTSTANSRN